MDDPTIAKFLARLEDGAGGVEILAGIIDLLGSEYSAFCTNELPTLLDSLANDNIATNAIVGPALRGNTRWDLTYAGRLSGRVSPVQFVTRLPVRNFSLPENQLVRWLVANLGTTISTIEARLGSSAIPERLRAIRDACNEAIKHHWFKDVPPPGTLDIHMLTSAMRRRLPAYRAAANLAGRRSKFASRDRTNRWKHIVTLLAANWLSPISDDDLFELYALVFVLDLLENECAFGSPVQFGLNATGRSHVAKFQKGEASVHVFFDQSPAVFLKAHSAQLDLLEAHNGIRPVPRRPDIVIVYGSGSVRRILFVEVKRSADGGYLSDSIYKAFGYCKDFADLWPATANPKVAVVVPENVSLKPGKSVSEMEVVLISSVDRQGLGEAIQAALLK